MLLDVGVRVCALHARHLFEKSFGSGFLAVDFEILHGLLGEQPAVFLIHHQEVFGITYAVDFALQEFDAEAVDSADEIVDAPAVNHSADAAFHLLGCLVCKCEAQDVAWRNADIIDKIGIAVGKHARFAGACACHDLHRAFGFLDRAQLLAVERYRRRFRLILIAACNKNPVVHIGVVEDAA